LSVEDLVHNPRDARAAASLIEGISAKAMA
jgi:hypothetical protein